MKKLSIIIPVYNEEMLVAETLKRVEELCLPKEIIKEVVVVNDASTDKTKEVLTKIQKEYKFKLINHSINQGKGKAVMTGMQSATGDYIVIQDADLEYHPKDILKLLTPVLEGQAEVVYGTRLRRLPNIKKEENHSLFLLHFLGNRSLSLMTSILYGTWLTDMETCYKLFPKKALDSFVIHARGFEFEPEITAKLLKNGYKIIEVSISTTPRGYDEGKKLNTITDGIKALTALLKYRFVN